MAPHTLEHTAGPDFLLPSIPTGSETGRQQRAQLNSDFEFWVLVGGGSWVSSYTVYKQRFQS